jgi:hypothetical protein
MPDAVAQVCNPSYLGGRVRENESWFKANPGKMLAKSNLV